MATDDFPRAEGVGDWRSAILLVLVVAGVFAPTLAAPLFMDDFAHLLLIEEKQAGPVGLGFNTYGVTAIPRDRVAPHLPWWTSDDFEFNYYRPLSSLLLAADHRLWGRSAWGYHLTSLLFHFAACLLVLRLAGVLGIGKGPALACSLLFGLHFGNLWTVYWVSNRSDTVAACLVIVSFLAYRKARQSVRRKDAALYFLAASFTMGLGILAKEIVFALPVLFFLYDLLLEPRPPSRTGGSSRWRRACAWLGRRVYPSILFFCFSASYLAWYVARGFGVRSGYAPMTLDIGLGAKLVFMAKSWILSTASLATFLPPGVKIHERLLAWPLLPFAAVFSAAAVLGIGALIFWPSVRSRRFRLFALAWVFLFMGPTLGLLPSSRYLYLSSIGYALLAGSVLADVVATPWGARHRRGVWAAVVVYSIVLPGALDLIATPAFTSEFRRAQTGLVEQYRQRFGEIRNGQVILLVNTPSQATPSLVCGAFRFYNPGREFRVWALTNFQELPSLEQEDERTLSVHAPAGRHFLESPADWIYLTSREFALGQTFRTSDFEAMVTAMDAEGVTEVTFRMERPLSDPDLVAVCFRDGKMIERCPF